MRRGEKDASQSFSFSGISGSAASSSVASFMSYGSLQLPLFGLSEKGNQRRPSEGKTNFSKEFQLVVRPGLLRARFSR